MSSGPLARKRLLTPLQKKPDKPPSETRLPIVAGARKTGIAAVGAVPWGTHLCQFYETKQDLFDILVPFTKAGLEDNEFCIWITSGPLSEKEVEQAMSKAVPNFAQYLERGQICLVPHTEFYFEDGVFNLKRVQNILMDKLNQALAKGYDGLRTTGNTAWVRKKDRREFTDYEAEIGKVIGEYRVLSICTYSLDKCGISEVMDVVGSHQGTLTKRAGNWVFTERSESRRLQHDLGERRKELDCLYSITNIAERPGITLDGLYQDVANLLPKGWQYPEIASAKITIYGKEFRTENYRETEWKQSSDINVRGARTGTVEIDYLEARPEIDEGPFLREERLLIDAVAQRLGGVTERKQAEESQEVTSRATSEGYVTLLQDRLVKSGFEDLTDAERIRLIFSLCRHSPECGERIEACITHFKTVSDLMSASDEELRQAGVCQRGVFVVRLLRELPAEILRSRIIEKPFYKSSQEIFDYLYYSMRDLKQEVLKAIYLDSGGHIIDTVDLFEGTLESVPIRPRDIVDSAIKHGTAAIIFVHNHPSGDPVPSKSDKQLTRDLVFVGKIIQIKVLDHMIIGGNRYFSFADEGLIEKYELDFLNYRIRRVS